MVTINILLSRFQSLLSYKGKKWPQIEMTIIYRATVGKLECQFDVGLFTKKKNKKKSL